MGFFDFLKRKKEKIEENDKVKFEELESWIQGKIKKNWQREEELLSLVKQRISLLVTEFGDELRILKSMDLRNKKAEDKIKFLVNENLNSYIAFLSGLRDNLNDLDKSQKTLESFMARMNFVFYDFNKKSFTSYEKATFLIGDELSKVRESIRVFLNDLNGILENDKSIVQNSKIFNLVLSKLSEVKENETSKAEIEENIRKVEQKLAEAENKAKEIEKNIEKTMNSEEYAQRVRKRAEIELKTKEIKNDMIKLKESFDFKGLAKALYGDEKKMRILKDYELNFYEYLEADNLSNLLSLIEESKKNILIKQVTDIINRKKELGVIDNKDETSPLKGDLEMANSARDALLREKSNELKRIQKLAEQKKEIIDMIRSELAKMKVELI